MGGTQVQPTEHYRVGNLPPRAGGEDNQDMCPIMGSGQHMLPLERDARMHFEACHLATQATFAKDRQDSQTTLASYQQDTLTSLAEYHEEEEEEGMFHEEEESGSNVQPGCPANCEICLYGAHL